MVIAARKLQLFLFGADVGADFFFFTEVEGRPLDPQESACRQADGVVLSEAFGRQLQPVGEDVSGAVEVKIAVVSQI